MKITDFIIIFLIISLPTYFYIEFKSSNSVTYAELNQHHETAITVAAQDAVDVLRTNVVPKLEVGYESYKINPTDPDIAFETFLHTLSLNYGITDENTKDVLSRYVPAFAVLEYDGLLLNVYQEHTNANGEKELSRVWLPKIPFSYTDNEGNVINFTIDEDVEVYDIELNEWFFGKRNDVKEDVTVDLLEDETNFNQIRRTHIVNTLQDNFAYYINEHNVYSKYLDVTYKFAMPLIPEEDWYNTVDDISIFAFFQGYQYSALDQVFHEYAFVGTRLNKTDKIMAGHVDGEKKFWYESCEFNYPVEELYSTKKQAAANGYRELSCLNPQ